MDNVAGLIGKRKSGPIDYGKQNVANMRKKQAEIRERQTKAEETKQKNIARTTRIREARTQNLSPAPDISKSHSHICQDTEQQVPAVLRKDPLQDAKVANPAFGKTPQYLNGVKKRLEFDRQERERAAEKAKLPPGMRLLTEEERIDSLHQFLEQKDATFLAINKLPLVLNTISLRNRRKELENQITELEKAIKEFTRPQVLIRDD